MRRLSVRQEYSIYVFCEQRDCQGLVRHPLWATEDDLKATMDRQCVHLAFGVGTQSVVTLNHGEWGFVG